MRRLTAGPVLAAAAAAASADTHAFIAPARPRLAQAIRRSRSSCFGWSARSSSSHMVLLQSVQGQQDERLGGSNEDEAYGRDDQRTFWDTVVKVCAPIIYSSIPTAVFSE